MGVSSGFMSGISVKIVKRRSVKQLSTTPLNSIYRGLTWQRPCFETNKDTAHDTFVNTPAVRGVLEDGNIVAVLDL